MTYAKHIETFELRNASEPVSAVDFELAIAAAIDLMRAATPKDAEAERDECMRVVYTTTRPPELSERVRVSRAAARAEGYARCKEGVERVLSLLSEDKALSYVAHAVLQIISAASFDKEAL